MSAKILDGRSESEKILYQLKKTVSRRRKKPLLATIITGQRYDSLLYVRLKEQAAKKVGIRAQSFRLPASAPQKKLIQLIESLNKQKNVSGILLQLPLPSHIDPEQVINHIDRKKDVDGFHYPQNKIVSPLISSILHLVTIAKCKKHGQAVILARRTAFTSTLSQILQKHGFITKTINPSRRIPSQTKTADLIIIASGRGPRLLAQHIKQGAVIIDAGIRKFENKTTGDVDPSCYTKARAISPVPGGVGPLTVAFVLKNTVALAKSQ